MQNQNARVVRNLCIAALILSILVILGSLISVAFLGLGAAALNDPSVTAAATYELETDGTLESYGLTGEDAVGLTAFVLGLGGMYFVWAIICSIVALVAAILGMRNYDKVDKLGGAFGWAIAGAVFSFLCGNLVIMILLIISAVYINKVRKAPMVPYGQPQPQPVYTPYQQGAPTQQPTDRQQ